MMGIPESEKRRRRAEVLYELEMGIWEAGFSSEFVYDEDHDLFRFADDGEFAFSKEYVNEQRLREQGMIG
jgi:hypothetical protein